jgi:hypothetical protein
MAIHHLAVPIQLTIGCLKIKGYVFSLSFHLFWIAVKLSSHDMGGFVAHRISACLGAEGRFRFD